MTDPRPLLVLARIIIDDLHFVDGSVHAGTPGGAGLHAAAGAALWWPKIAIVAGTGSDIHDVTHDMMLGDRYVTDGLLVRDLFSVRSKLVYFPGGNRTETSLFGGDHFARLEASAADIPPSLLPAAGTYIFRDTDAAFWRELASMRASLGTILWELHADAATPAYLPALRDLLPVVDVFSVNLSEARGLFGDVPPETLLEKLFSAGARLVLLRMGARGTIAATTTQRLQATPPPCAVIDETGGGNSFCGGFLASLCAAPDDIGSALRHATASAACTIGALGPATGDRQRATVFADATVVTQLSQAVMA